MRISRTVVTSGGGSPANARGMWTRLAAPAKDSVVKNRRRVCVSGIGLLLIGLPKKWHPINRHARESEHRGPKLRAPPLDPRLRGGDGNHLGFHRSF
jgi:hypothetical protein